MPLVPNFNLDVAKIATYVAKPSSHRNIRGIPVAAKTADKENELTQEEVSGVVQTNKLSL